MGASISVFNYRTVDWVAVNNGVSHTNKHVSK